ncbi:schwannomin-interacting protein 1-like [Scyliorhinus canicula]|uniref:schwannomin-interacting protein 1-like n=1 Tax=Scyliorhinus canicula TaxID=7830 RepID=UPI0018F63D03|nr:schwannomin-interacting protein 1-like [Scyliorhinus canicula]XP_038642921.1 schwannomin-interacting protein 1-like [Scyliorhinus canicula]
MDSGGELFHSLISRSDSDRSQLVEQKPSPGPGTGSSDDDEGFQDCELKAPEAQGDATRGGPEVPREQYVLPAGEISDVSPRERLSAPRCAAHPTETPPTPGTWMPDEAGSDMPIMNWEALENHIAGLQLRENEKQARERNANPAVVAADQSPLWRRKTDGSHRFTSQERVDSNSWQMTGFSCATRFHSRMNLQLCFINESSSDSDTEEPAGGAAATPSPQGTRAEEGAAEGSLLSRRKELESEAKRGLALLKRRLDLEKQQSKASPRQSHALELSDLRQLNMKQIQNRQSSIFSQIHGFNTQLMELLEIRDDLKTEQDAMLVEIGDLTH